MNTINHLKKLSLRVNKHFIEFGVPLNFKGYTSFRKELSSLKDEDMVGIYELIKEANLWYEYMSEIEQVSQFILELTSERDYYDGLSLIETDEKKLDKYNYYYQAVKDLQRFNKTIIATRKELSITSRNLSKLYYKSFNSLNWGFNY